MNNTGNALRERGHLKAAKQFYEIGLQIHRLRLEAGATVTRKSDVVTSLGNLAITHDLDGDYATAAELLLEAEQISRELTEQHPQFRPLLAKTLSNLAFVYEGSGQDALALETSRRAIEVVEDGEPLLGALWLDKGEIGSSYERWLDHLVRRGEVEGAFRCLAAMREGRVRATVDNTGESVSTAVRTLASVQSRVERRISVLTAQNLTGSKLLLGALVTGGVGQLSLYHADDFRKSARELVREVLTIFDLNDPRDGKERRAALERLGRAAWEALPSEIQSVLAPDSESDIIISADPVWTAFPWEALRFGDGEDDWLGLRRTLGRWGPLTGEALEGLSPFTFGEGERKAGIVCPWNASSDPR